MTYDEALALGLWFYNIDVYSKSVEAVDPAWKEAMDHFHKRIPISKSGTNAEVLSLKKEEG